MAEFAISRVTLHSRLQSGRLTPGEALAIATETGRVLAEAHAAGRIHGNLTSSSIQLKDSSAPEVTIQGFGDQVINDASSHNAGLVGNAGNLAPERIAGGPPTIAADIYSFGGILEQIRSATSFDAVTDREWDTAVSRCVDPAPGRRFHSGTCCRRSETRIGPAHLRRQRAAARWNLRSTGASSSFCSGWVWEALAKCIGRGT
jgi:serine/threonine protein kinase